MTKKFILKSSEIPNIQAIEVERINNQVFIIQHLAGLDLLKIRSAEFNNFKGCENMVAIDNPDDPDSFGKIKFIEVGDYWIYPTFTTPQFAEISYKNTFHPSITIKKL